jgi:hypothetical protein
MTYDQVEARKQKAVRFLRDIVGDDDRADEVEDEDVQDYADRKGLVIKNAARQIYSNPKRRTTNVANGDMTKNELQDAVDQAIDILCAAYTPEASREDLAGAVGDAIDVLSGENGGDDDQDDDGDDDDDSGNGR